MNAVLLNFGAATICWDHTILINGGGVSGNRTLFDVYNILIYLQYFYHFWPRGNSGVILAENRVKSDDVFTIERLLFGSLFVLVGNNIGLCADKNWFVEFVIDCLVCLIYPDST